MHCGVHYCVKIFAKRKLFAKRKKLTGSAETGYKKDLRANSSLESNPIFTRIALVSYHLAADVGGGFEQWPIVPIIITTINIRLKTAKIHFFLLTFLTFECWLVDDIFLIFS